ncbi:hypothetical protein FE840_008085 [Peteryoungia desertarenae]|uniref:DUF2946 domain-containing protein n=1 Tax=Peteryoungia desertarenae TaxID=1813451 RepID=A0ABX6QN02_9HYPH|nr:hypothetical protein [Peteryoungia desertarenae]QLF69505.1 hypothetical protein FE840_008085 [Peteryoungia desertarenae]
MMMLLRSLLVIAALAYAVMPMHGAMAMVVTPAAQPIGQTDSGHSGHQHGGTMAITIGCPHGFAAGPQELPHHPMMSDDHCSACLTILSARYLTDAGPAARAAEAPGISRSLVSTPASPPERPPRLRA